MEIIRKVKRLQKMKWRNTNSLTLTLRKGEGI